MKSTLELSYNEEPPPFDQIEPLFANDGRPPFYLIEGIPTTLANNFPNLWANFTGNGDGEGTYENGDGGYKTLLPSTSASIITQLTGNASSNTGSSSALDTAYFGDIFLQLNVKYRLVHGELSLFVCVFGIIANVLNIIVLSRLVKCFCF